MSKPNIIVRMGARNWDAHVKTAEGSYVTFDFRKMTSKQRSDFHRELLNAFRKARQ